MWTGLGEGLLQGEVVLVIVPVLFVPFPGLHFKIYSISSLIKKKISLKTHIFSPYKTLQEWCTLYPATNYC